MKLLKPSDFRQVVAALKSQLRCLRFTSNLILETRNSQENHKFFISDDEMRFGASISSEELNEDIDYFVHLFTQQPLTAETVEDFWTFFSALPIDWSNKFGIHLAQITSDVLSAISSRIDRNKYHIDVNCDMCNSYIHPTKLEDDCQLPHGYRFDQMKLSEADWICSQWKFHSPRTIVTMRHLINCGRAPVVRHISEEKPVGWCLGSQYGQIFMLSITESHRRKGLAKALVDQMVKIFVEQGVRTHAIAEKDNTASNQLFTSLNWDTSDDVLWVQITNL